MTQNNQSEGSQEFRNKAPYDQFGQISLRVDARDHKNLFEVRGLLMARYKKNFTMADTLHVSIEGTLAALKADVAIEGLTNIETQ